MDYGHFFKGENRSKYEQEGFNDTANLDVHSQLGSAQPNLALTNESTTPNEACISAIVPNGDTFFFSTASGKIWKRTAAGVYSLVHTNANGAHKGAMSFNGTLYYATSAKLGSQTDALASSEATWSSHNDSFATFTKAGAYKPMTAVGAALYIGDGSYVAMVDSSGTFTADGLDLPTEYTISALVGVKDDLLIGTIIGANVSGCKAFLWDRVSPSFTYQDDVPEIGINCFIKGDGIVFAQCGTVGNIYYWSGSEMVKFRQIRGITTGVAPYNAALLNGKPLFACGTEVFSIHREGADFPYAIVQEYTASASISSLSVKLSDLLVSVGTAIQHLGANYATAVIETPESQISASRVVVAYDSLPSGCSIGISTKVDGGSWVAQTTTTDTIRKTVSFDGDLGTVNTVQAKITLTPNTTAKPVVKKITIE